MGKYLCLFILKIKYLLKRHAWKIFALPLIKAFDLGEVSKSSADSEHGTVKAVRATF